MPPLILPGFVSIIELNDMIVDAMRTVDRYPDYGTKAEILTPAIRAAKMLQRRSRCCWRHRLVAWLAWLNLLCMRQFFLRCSWRNDGMGTGSTIWFWRNLGIWVAKCKACRERISHSDHDDLMQLVAGHVCKEQGKDDDRR